MTKEEIFNLNDTTTAAKWLRVTGRLALLANVIYDILFDGVVTKAGHPIPGQTQQVLATVANTSIYVTHFTSGTQKFKFSVNVGQMEKATGLTLFAFASNNDVSQRWAEMLKVLVSCGVLRLENGVPIFDNDCISNNVAQIETVVVAVVEAVIAALPAQFTTEITTSQSRATPGLPNNKDFAACLRDDVLCEQYNIQFPFPPGFNPIRTQGRVEDGMATFAATDNLMTQVVKVAVSYLRQGEGCASTLMTGRAGTGKSRGVMEIASKLKLPFDRITLSRDLDVKALLGDFMLGHDGTVNPAMGSLSESLRRAMIQAFVFRLRAGRMPTEALTKAKGKLALLQSMGRPVDQLPQFIAAIEANNDLGYFQMTEFYPYDKECWHAFVLAYNEMECQSAGCFRVLFLDEIYDAFGASQMDNLLKTMLADERALDMSKYLGGWGKLHAFNVCMVGAGNPQAMGGQMLQAISSRFTLTVPKGYPTTEEEVAGNLQTLATYQSVNGELWDELFVKPLGKSIKPSEKIVRAVVQFAQQTRTMLHDDGSGNAPEICINNPLDWRGSSILAGFAASMRELAGYNEAEATRFALQVGVNSILLSDEHGIPLPKFVNEMRDKINTQISQSF